MSLEKTEIFLLQNLEKYKALYECAEEISEKINEKAERIASILIDKLETAEDWVISDCPSGEGWFQIVPRKWQNLSSGNPFHLDVSNFGLTGLFQVAEDAVAVEFVKDGQRKNEYVELFRNSLETLGYECTPINQHTDTLYSQNSMDYKNIIDNSGLNLNSIAEFLKILVQPSVALIDEHINSIEIE